MSGNTFGKILRLTTFGESHGTAIGGSVDGCPAGIALTEEDIQMELDLRRPGQGGVTTARKESDRVHLLSGVFNGYTEGTPIGFIIYNEDQRSQDYSNLASVFRPGHADWSYFCKYKSIRDYRGGGRASGRETACRVVAGVIAKKILTNVFGAVIQSGTIELGGIAVKEDEVDLSGAIKRPYFAGSGNIISKWNEIVARSKTEGDTLGGIVRIVAHNIPAGLGEPVFMKLDAMLAYALMSVGAVKGVEIGSGFSAARLKGSQNNDQIFPISTLAGNDMKANSGKAFFASNNAGGILGGISTGQPIIAQVAVKPIASINREQSTINKEGNAVKITVGGRHDISAIPRIVPVLSAMMALTLADALLLQSRMDVLL